MRATPRMLVAFTFVAVCCALLVGVAALNPRVASHLGYALPGDGALPDRISYAGRDYALGSVCWTASEMQQHDEWPLHQVSQIPTLLGAPHPLMAAPVPEGYTTMALAVPRGSCYVMYGIEGGP